MFLCDTCKLPIGPRISPIMVTTMTRERGYENLVYNVEEDIKQKVSSYGSEIVSEAKLCHPCAGVEVRSEPPVDIKHWLTIAKHNFDHAKGCKGVKTRTVNGEKVTEDCKMCQRIILSWASVPVNILPRLLAE